MIPVIEVGRIVECPHGHTVVCDWGFGRPDGSEPMSIEDFVREARSQWPNCFTVGEAPEACVKCAGARVFDEMISLGWEPWWEFSIGQRQSRNRRR